MQNYSLQHLNYMTARQTVLSHLLMYAAAGYYVSDPKGTPEDCGDDEIAKELSRTSATQRSAQAARDV